MACNPIYKSKRYTRVDDIIPNVDYLQLSEAYHKAKAEGSNPELVAAVEELLGQETSPSVQATQTTVEEGAKKETAKPTKTERKAIAEAKIDDLAAKAKEFLRNKNLPEGTKKAGIGQDDVIDVLASTVKALVNSGIEISEAIKQVRELFEQDFDTSAIKDYEISQAIARDELTDFAKENGFSSYREAVFAVNKYVREVGKEDVITKEEITKAKEAKAKETPTPKKGYTSKKKKAQEGKASEERETKTSKFYQTSLAYVQNTPKRMIEFLKANPLSYGVVTNQESMDKAIEYIEKNGFQETLKKFLNNEIEINGEFEKIVFIGYLLRGGLSEKFNEISESMKDAKNAEELEALQKDADDVFNDMNRVFSKISNEYAPSLGRGVQAFSLFAQDLTTEDGAIFYFSKLVEKAAQKVETQAKEEIEAQTEIVDTVVTEGKAAVAKQVTEYIVKNKNVQAKNATKLSAARQKAQDAKAKLKDALSKYKNMGIANDPWQEAKKDVDTIKALTDYVSAQLKYKSVQATQIVKEVAALLGINARNISKSDIQDIINAAKVQAEKEMSFEEITETKTPKGSTYAERVGKELSNDPSVINKTVESIIDDYYMGNQTLDEIIAMVKERFDVTDAQAITISRQIQESINKNITKVLEKQLDRKIKQLNDKRLKEEGLMPAKERKQPKSIYDIMAQAQIMGALDSEAIQDILKATYNVPTMTSEDVQFVKDTYAKINNTGDLTRKAQLIADMHKRFNSKDPVSFYDIYNSWWYGSVLSGPSTTDVNIAYGPLAIGLAIKDAISGIVIDTAKIISNKIKGKENAVSVALEARILFESLFRAINQTGTLNLNNLKTKGAVVKESLPFYESYQNLISTIFRGNQAFNEELRNADISSTDNSYLKDYKPTGFLGKLLTPLIYIDKKTGIFTFIPKYTGRAINAADIFFGTTIKNLQLASVLKAHYIKQGLKGNDLKQAILNDLNRDFVQLQEAKNSAAKDRLNIDLEIKNENGKFVVYDSGKKSKSFDTEKQAKAYMNKIAYIGDKYNKGVVDYLNAHLPLDVVMASRQISADYMGTGDVKGAVFKFFYNSIILNIRNRTTKYMIDKSNPALGRLGAFAVSRVFEFIKFPLNLANLAIQYTPALVFLRAKYKGDEGSLYAQMYNEKAQQRFLTGFYVFMSLTAPTLLSQLILKGDDDDEEDKKQKQELADSFFKRTGKKINIDNPIFKLPKDGEMCGSLSFFSPEERKFLKENNLAVPYHRWNEKLKMWEDYSSSPMVFNYSMVASISDYNKYVINDKTKFTNKSQKEKEFFQVLMYFAGNLTQTFINAAGIKSQNQLLLTLNSNNAERKIDAAVDLAFSSIQTNPALLRQLRDALDGRLRDRVSATEKPIEYLASRIPLGGLFVLGNKKYDMFGNEIKYLTGADRGLVMKHLFVSSYKDYEVDRAELGRFLYVNGYEKRREFELEYGKKDVIDAKNPEITINGIKQFNYVEEPFTQEEMDNISLEAHRKAAKAIEDNKVILQNISNAVDLEKIPLIAPTYEIPFNQAIDKIYDSIFQDEWKQALVKKNYVSDIGATKYEAEAIKPSLIPLELKRILKQAEVEPKIPAQAKTPIEFQNR